mgnify:CR=1 FL=1
MLRIRMIKEHPLLIVEHHGEGTRIDDEEEEKREGGGEGKKRDRDGERKEKGDDGAYKWARYLVAADLHIGFEHRLKGVRVMDDGYVHEMLDEILSIADDEQCNGIILLGDIKDSIKGMSVEERKNIPLFITELARHVDELYIVPGNHDSYLRLLLPDHVRLMSSKGMLIDDTLFIHGHTIPKSTGVRRIIMGHLHPVVSRRDSILDGERVWLILKVRSHHEYDKGKHDMLEVIVVPSFNRYIRPLHAHKVDAINTSTTLTKIIGGKGIARAAIVTLDGSVIGDENTLNDIILSV